MTDTINKIRIDLDRHRCRTSISIAKGDMLSRTIYITLLNGGTVFSIPEGAIATLLASKPDGKKVYNDCALIEDEVVYSVSNQLIAVQGDVTCQILLTMPDQTQITTPPFLINVYERMFDESVLESTNDYSALQTYCIRAQEAAVKAEDVVATTKAALQAVSKDCASQAVELKQKIDAITHVEEVTASKVLLEKEKNIALVTNVQGVTAYEWMAEPDNPVEAVSLADSGSIRLIMSDSPTFEWVDDELKITGFKNPLRSVIHYHDELCYINTEMCVRRRIKETSLTADNEWTEVNLFEGTSFEGTLYAYATPLSDAIINPDGVWYTSSHFRYEITDINDVPKYGVAYQAIPGYAVFVIDKPYELFIDWLGTRTINVLYVAENPTLDSVLDFNGILRYNTLSDLYLAVDFDYHTELTVQKPVSHFANAVMELL